LNLFQLALSGPQLWATIKHIEVKWHRRLWPKWINA
ncbi:MAG: hypothetical protein RIS94_2015, partial [Pseudomonadota bacterium]